MTDGGNQLAGELMDIFRRFRQIHMKPGLVEGMTPGEAMMLIRLSKLSKCQEQGTKVSDISTSMNVAPPTVTQLINTLEAGGYVERNMDRTDRRAVRVRLTEKGEEVVERADDFLSEKLSGLIEYLGEEKSRELINIMEMVYTYFREANKSATQK